MLTSMDGVMALTEIRVDLECEVGTDYPHAVLRELLLLYDVCRALGLDMQLTEGVLGSRGFRAVRNHLEVRFSPTPAAEALITTQYEVVAQ